MIVHSTEAAGLPASWLKMSEVCERFRVHPNTVRLATNSGRLTCYRLNGLSHRRFRESDVLEWLGCDSREGNQEDGTVPIALVARVSGYSQAKDRTGKAAPDSSDAKGDLGRQVARIREFIGQKYGEAAHITEYVRIASGLNLEHPTLLRLLSAIMKGAYSGGAVVVENKERLARWSWPLWEVICRQHNTELIVISHSEEKSAEAEMLEDMMSLTHIYSCKLYAKRSSNRSRVLIPSDVEIDILKWLTEGISIRQVAQRLASEGRNLNSAGRIITKDVLKNFVKAKRKVLEAMAVDHRDSSLRSSNTFEQFASLRLRLVTSGSKVGFAKLYRAYQSWCETEGKTALPSKDVLRLIRSRYPDVYRTRSKNEDGNTVFDGISLLKS